MAGLNSSNIVENGWYTMAPTKVSDCCYSRERRHGIPLSTIPRGAIELVEVSSPMVQLPRDSMPWEHTEIPVVPENPTSVPSLLFIDDR